MFDRLHAQLHEIRLDLGHARLRRRERALLRRLGEEAARSGTSTGMAGAGRLEQAIAAGTDRIEALTREGHASLQADRADLATVAAWVRPIVVVRGICTRLVLRHSRSAVRRAMGPHCEALGELAAGSADLPEPLQREVAAVRAALAGVAAERERRLAAFGGSALPAWSARAGAEASGMGRAVVSQLRSHFLPKAPALAGLAVGWWIANTYTDSHLRSALRSVGIGSGGTRVVSSSTYEAMSFWLPLLAAALCAYAGERIAAFYGNREAGGMQRER